MKFSSFHFSSSITFALILTMTLACSAVVVAQSDLQRQTIAITYPLDQTVSVSFRGTTRLPRLTGEAKVKRSGRRGTRVELSIDNLPRAFELGAPYTTYVLWAITPEGRVDSLGEIKRSGSIIFNSKVDVTTPLQTFALIVTAEPHFLVRTPSRVVVLENLPPRDPGDAQVATVAVQYIGNTSDYFNEARVPEVADKDYARTPVSLLGARQAINLARYAGAARDAVNELKEADTQLEQAESAWRLKRPEAEVDQLARTATSLGARAEEIAGERRESRERRDEALKRDEAIRDAERNATDATDEVTKLKAELAREQRERDLVQRDLVNTTEQLRDNRSEVARLRDELQSVRAEADEAKVKLARIEGERASDEARRQNEQRIVQARAAQDNLRAELARFGTVRESAAGLVLVLPESLWSNARAAQLTSTATTTLEPLAALLANNPDYRIRIESHTDNRGTEPDLRQLTQQRADKLSELLVQGGIESARIQAAGIGAAAPLVPNRSVATRTRNRRVEITLIPASTTTTATQTGNGN